VYVCLAPVCPSVIFAQEGDGNTVQGMLVLRPKIQRRSQRQWFAVPVRMGRGGSHIDGVTINVSEHGIYAFAATKLSVGDEIEITFCPPGRKKIVCARGVVRRKAVYLYGIEFLNHDTAIVGEPTRSYSMRA
jgi:hypothetical protein